MNNTEFLFGEINDTSSDNIVKWIVGNQTKSEVSLLTLYINSMGGNVPDAFAIIDMMRVSTKKISTIGIGSINSSAFLIFASGTKGHRYISKYTSIMCHQYNDEVSGKYHDLKSHVREMELINQRMVEHLSTCTDSLTLKSIKSKLFPPTDVWLTAQEMVEMGFADHIF